MLPEDNPMDNEWNPTEAEWNRMFPPETEREETLRLDREEDRKADGIDARLEAEERERQLEFQQTWEG